MNWGWGEYEGKPVQRVPREYLRWVDRTFDRGSKWQKIAEAELAARDRRALYQGVDPGMETYQHRVLRSP